MHHARNTNASSSVHDHVGSETVGENEVFAALNRAIDVAFCSKVHNRVVSAHCGLYVAGLADVALHKRVTLVVVDIFEGGKVAGVCERVEHGHRMVGVSEHPSHVIRADKTCSASNKNLHGQTSGTQANVGLKLWVNLVACWVLLITLRQYWRLDTPIGFHHRVVPRKAALVCRVVIAVY